MTGGGETDTKEVVSATGPNYYENVDKFIKYLMTRYSRTVSIKFMF